MLELTQTSTGTRLTVKVSPNAKREVIVGLHGGALKIAVIAQPQKGKANKAVIALLAEALGVAARQVEIVRGQTASLKTVVVDGVAPEAVRERLAPYVS